MFTNWLRLALLACLLAAGGAQAHETLHLDAPKPDLAPTPPMGWNSWNKFACNVSEQLIREQADAMAASGMKAAGYTYIVIDDCWQKSRDADGNIQPDPERFPSGMKALADYVHGKGLKFGLYSDAGVLTCGGRPGSAGHEFQDARQYAKWGVDYLKYDWCHTGSRDAPAAYMLMAKALRESGRDILLSICEWGSSHPGRWAHPVGHLWRTTGDIRDAWQGPKEWSHGLLDIIDMNAELWSEAAPNGWNDPDMLEVGNGGMTTTEYESHFSIWAMLAAPLVAGNDMAKMDADTRRILTNAEVIKVDQDPLGRQGRRVWRQGPLEVWVRPLQGGDRAVVLFNRGDAAAEMSVSWELLDLPTRLKADVHDLWSGRKTHGVAGRTGGRVASHGVLMLRVTPALP
ncbi:glycoside hydrolase family 27 protein [Roseateles saccharophilus]|uniref:Alpha-galactosidase n=1 Tax=Roseateles saccharophilus TaxID=304 RepID=A0A4R3URK7_ROSSA|nr:glycoside hydrolase family 27 protein [Roseateles saccharophilus]MDG0836150.1 glycoside hydrolase family 27 protein [Roseateles saccharophilus]TCU93287.1 alpha-galactosidase [Roseateles saccharophilus]